jgi:putative peptidoglycan lipid II flippase
MSGKLKNIFLVSGATILSRISGFARDAIFFWMFGLSDIGAAFLFAFTIPNLFRRLLGEGALSSAVIPVMSKLCVTAGTGAVLSLLRSVVTRLLSILVAITIPCCALSYFVATRAVVGEKWTITSHFLTILLPYMAFVCVAAIISAALNVFNRFLAAALNAIWLNLCMITSLLVGKFFLSLADISLLNCLSFGVILGGVVQYLVPSFALRNLGFKADGHIYSAEIAEILKLFWPGFLGSAVSQINLLVSRNLAYVYCASTVSVLYLANRLVELPLGVFGIAIATVIFPDMSKLAADKHLQSDLNRSFNHGIFSLLWILLPSAVGMYLLGREILSVLFEWGIFSVEDTAKTAPILSICCISIPFFGVSNLLVRSFHALKDTATPAKIGVIALAINFTLTIFLMHRFGVEGIASATAMSIVIQTLMLYAKLYTRGSLFRLNIGMLKLFKIALGLLLMCACIKFVQCAYAGKYVEYKQQALRTILVCIPLAAVVYAAVSLFPLKKPCKNK